MCADKGQWLEYQRKRKGRLLAAYLAKLPNEMQGKIIDAIVPEAKDIGIQLPGKPDPGAVEDILRLSLGIPRRCRKFLSNQAPHVFQGGVQLLIPPPATPVTLRSAAGDANVLLRKIPLADWGAANTVCFVNNGTLVTLDDEWVEILTNEQLRGWMKTKHCRGRTRPKDRVKIVDAGGAGSSMLRHKAIQDSSQANIVGFIPNNTEVEIVESWSEIKLHGQLQGLRGFVKAHHVSDTDVLLQGPAEECWKAAKVVRDILKFDPCPMPVAAGGKGKGKGKGGKVLAEFDPVVPMGLAEFDPFAPFHEAKGKGKGKHK